MSTYAKWKNVFYLLLLFFVGGRTFGGESPDLIADSLISILKYNESAITSYQGKVTQTEFRVVERNDDRKYLKPYTEPLKIRTIEIDFIHDTTRGEDFRVTMKNSSDLFSFGSPVVSERRNGSYVESLLQTGSLQPTYGIIPELKNSRYLGHAPRNLDACSNVYVVSSAHESGYARISPSECMRNSEYVWSFGEEQVEGYRCHKYAMLAKASGCCYLSYIWFGEDVNYNIVKQQTLRVAEELYIPFSDWVKYEDDVEKLIAHYETRRPMHLMVNTGYVKTPDGIWVPGRTKAYVVGALRQGKNVANIADYAEIIKVAKLDTHTSGLNDCVLGSYHIWQLDMESLKLNETIDPSVFTESIIPDGVPVSNFRFDIHPRDIERIAVSNELLGDSEPGLLAESLAYQGATPQKADAAQDGPNDLNNTSETGIATETDPGREPEVHAAGNEGSDNSQRGTQVPILAILLLAIAVTAGASIAVHKRKKRTMKAI